MEPDPIQTRSAAGDEALASEADGAARSQVALTRAAEESRAGVRLDLDRERAPRGGDWSTEIGSGRRKKPRADEREKTRARRRREEAAAAAGRGGRELGRTAAAATRKKS
jgi:hypothetical protein